eukprot:COSAG06_NODE_56563_length_284_cov_0.810811_2_plen_34_part_01
MLALAAAAKLALKEQRRSRWSVSGLNIQAVTNEQ